MNFKVLIVILALTSIVSGWKVYDNIKFEKGFEAAVVFLESPDFPPCTQSLKGTLAVSSSGFINYCGLFDSADNEDGKYTWRPVAYGDAIGEGEADDSTEDECCPTKDTSFSFGESSQFWKTFSCFNTDTFTEGQTCHEFRTPLIDLRQISLGQERFHNGEDQFINDVYDFLSLPYLWHFKDSSVLSLEKIQHYLGDIGQGIEGNIPDDQVWSIPESRLNDVYTTPKSGYPIITQGNTFQVSDAEGLAGVNDPLASLSSCDIYWRNFLVCDSSNCENTKASAHYANGFASTRLASTILNDEKTRVFVGVGLNSEGVCDIGDDLNEIGFPSDTEQFDAPNNQYRLNIVYCQDDCEEFHTHTVEAQHRPFPFRASEELQSSGVNYDFSGNFGVRVVPLNGGNGEEYIIAYVTDNLCLLNGGTAQSTESACFGQDPFRLNFIHCKNMDCSDSEEVSQNGWYQQDWIALDSYDLIAIPSGASDAHQAEDRPVEFYVSVNGRFDEERQDSGITHEGYYYNKVYPIVKENGIFSIADFVPLPDPERDHFEWKAEDETHHVEDGSLSNTRYQQAICAISPETCGGANQKTTTNAEKVHGIAHENGDITLIGISQMNTDFVIPVEGELPPQQDDKKKRQVFDLGDQYITRPTKTLNGERLELQACSYPSSSPEEITCSTIFTSRDITLGRMQSENPDFVAAQDGNTFENLLRQSNAQISARLYISDLQVQLDPETKWPIISFALSTPYGSTDNQILYCLNYHCSEISYRPNTLYFSSSNSQTPTSSAWTPLPQSSDGTQGALFKVGPSASDTATPNIYLGFHKYDSPDPDQLPCSKDIVGRFVNADGTIWLCDTQQTFANLATTTPFFDRIAQISKPATVYQWVPLFGTLRQTSNWESEWSLNLWTNIAVAYEFMNYVENQV